jgi:nitrate/nitrite transporter NarK
MPAQHDDATPASPARGKARRKTLTMTVRNLLMVVVGFVVFAIVATAVLYNTIMYGDPIANFGIILMLTVPVIAGVAFRVGLDAWLDRE